VPEVIVEFQAESQSLTALREAAYRLIGEASCHIDSAGGVHVCRLSTPEASKVGIDAVQARFLDLLTDENLREQLAEKTDPLRNVIVALAFGSLVQPDAEATG
jgi:His-Xaa-Ser system protein HxsD